MERLFLLDAYALIYRAYYAFIKAPRINSKGQNTSAILGFVNTLEDVLRRQSPTHIGVAFDPAGPTFRHEAYADYKAQREETPEAIRWSVPVIKDIIRAYRIPILEVPGYEADDVIGTLATRAAAQGIDTYMMTPDKDYGQLVGPHVFMYRPRHGDKEFDTLGVEEVKEKFGIDTPAQVIDLLGLMGDSSDNIPGCPGVGEKTAQKLIAEFGSIDNLLSATDRLKGALRKKVEENAAQIRFSRFLATIKTDVPIELDMDALRREQPDEDALRAMFEDLEFRSLIDRVFRKDKPAPAPEQGSLFAAFDSAPQQEEEAAPARLARLDDLPCRYHLVETEADRRALAERLMSVPSFSMDTETTDTEAMQAELRKGDVCAVIIEGIQGIGGIRVPDPAFMQALREECTRTGTILILDEIQSGYGRSGRFFAHQWTDIRPDLITVAKGIGNGFPMGALLVSPMFTPVYGQLGTTFGGNHLACAAALAVLDVIEGEGLIENAARVGAHLLEELKKLPQIKEVRGRGLMIGVEFEQPIKELRSRLLHEQKVFTGVSGTNVIRLLPPLCLTMDEADTFLERFAKVL